MPQGEAGCSLASKGEDQDLLLPLPSLLSRSQAISEDKKLTSAWFSVFSILVIGIHDFSNKRKTQEAGECRGQLERPWRLLRTAGAREESHDSRGRDTRHLVLR